MKKDIIHAQSANHKMQIKLSKEIYNREAIIKAAYQFTDRLFVSIDTDRDYYYVKLDPKNKHDLGNIEQEFQNEVLIQTTRYNIMMQTKNIREIIIGRALASTIVDESDAGFIDDESFNAEEILQDWFEKHDSD